MKIKLLGGVAENAQAVFSVSETQHFSVWKTLTTTFLWPFQTKMHLVFESIQKI